MRWQEEAEAAAVAAGYVAFVDLIGYHADERAARDAFVCGKSW